MSNSDVLNTLQVVKTNPLMEKIKFPGKMIALPSKGLMYANGELSADVHDGEFQVKPLSALAEIKLKTADLLYSGQAFIEVIKECCPSVKDPLMLFAKDIDAIMCMIRLVSYGEDFDVSIAHTCDDKERKYTINLDKIMSNTKFLSAELVEETYTVKMENGQVVILEPIRLKHVIDTYQLAIVEHNRAEPFSSQEMEKIMVDNLLAMIRSVDGIADKNQIREWITQVPSKYINRITDKIEKSNETWGINFNHPVQCKNCGEAFVVDIPINPITFFSE